MKKLFALMLAAAMLCGACSAFAEAGDIAHSYCNPLNLDKLDVRTGTAGFSEEYPAVTAERALSILATEKWDAAVGRSMVRLGGGGRFQENAARAAADVFVYQISDGTLVMHMTGSMLNDAEYGACWTSTDYVHWEYHQMNRGVTAPTFMELNGKYYLCGNSSDVFVSDYPWGPWESIGKFRMPDGSEKGFGDVNFFQDDDGRLYLSYSIGSPIMACELNPENPTEVLTEPVEIWRNDGRHWFERFGSDNQNSVGAYTEGSQIFKYNGTYYLQVATNGTENISYCIAVKKSTEGPLSGWTYQQNNPVTDAVHNFVPAAGHGCFLVDKDNRLVLFYTQVLGFESGYDRLIGMDVCSLDENGDIHVTITDKPQLAPNLVADAAKGSDLGLAQVCTIGNAVWVSSYKEGYVPYNAVDFSAATSWMPAPDDDNPRFHAGLGGIYDVYAVQLTWKEMGQFTRDNSTLFTLEYFDLEANDWAVMYDGSANEGGRISDYLTFPEGIRTIAVRLTLLGTTENIPVGVAGLRIFGENYTMAEEHNRWADYPEL